METLRREPAPRLEAPVERLGMGNTCPFWDGQSTIDRKALYNRIIELGARCANVGGTAGVISSLRNDFVSEGLLFFLNIWRRFVSCKRNRSMKS